MDSIDTRKIDTKKMIEGDAREDRFFVYKLSVTKPSDVKHLLNHCLEETPDPDKELFIKHIREEILLRLDELTMSTDKAVIKRNRPYRKIHKKIAKETLLWIEQITGSPNKSEYSYSEFAKALDMKGITINQKGVGVNNKINYANIFGLRSGRTLYNRLNDLGHGRIKDTDSLESKGLEIIKFYNL